MAHTTQQQWVRSVAEAMPEFFTRTKVVDYGSLDINGTCREFLTEPQNYVGVDVGPGPNVDVVGLCHAVVLPFAPDLVISCEMLEHDRWWRESLMRMWAVCRPGGMVLFTCATTGRAEHGTRTSFPDSSPHTTDYYRNLTEADVRSVWDCKALFVEYEFSVGPPADLRFWGIKKKGG